MDILKDIVSGALPVSEIPGFVVWAMGKSFWFWFCLCMAAAGMIIGANL